ISGPDLSFLHPRGNEKVNLLATLIEVLEPRLNPIEGVWIERKGYTASVHFRQAPPGQFREICDIVHSTTEAFLEHFYVSLGRKVFDIRPNLYWDKGDAIAWIREAYHGAGAVLIYLGDDSTDEEAFASLPAESITIRVSPDGESHAAYHLEDPVQVENFL